MPNSKPGAVQNTGAVQKTGNWFKDNWGWLAGGGLLTWMMFDDSADEKMGNVGEGFGGLIGGFAKGLMPLLVSSGSLVCVLFIFFSMFAATSSRFGA